LVQVDADDSGDMCHARQVKSGRAPRGQKYHRTEIIQYGPSWAHWFLTFATAGLWYPVWRIFFRSKRRITYRYK
jgi:hypothetical protein